jgi:subtilisin family serine protease
MRQTRVANTHHRTLRMPALVLLCAVLFMALWAPSRRSAAYPPAIATFTSSELLEPSGTSMSRIYLPAVSRNHSRAIIPNDQLFSLQWGLHNIGQGGGMVNADINAPEAWDMSRGSSSVRIAVIDTGVALTHPEFSGRLVDGYNFVNNNTYANDGHGHGTHVAGIAAAAGNNGFGIAGVAWNVRIIPIRVLDNSGSGYISDVVDGIGYAVNKGARVINLSLGSPEYSQSQQDMVTYAYNKGVLVVVAAGNCGSGGSGCSRVDQPSYPAAGSHVLAVAATTRLDSLASFSTKGSYVDIAAPGAYILSTVPGDDYSYDSGTSMAAPFVSGLAALIYSRYPTYTPTQVARAILAHAEDLGTTGWDSRFGCGRINAARSLAYGAAGGGCSNRSGLSLSEDAVSAETGVAGDEDLNRAAILSTLETVAPEGYRPGVVLVKFLPHTDAAAMHMELAALDLTVVRTLSQSGVHLVAVTPGEEITLARQLLDHPGVAYAELDYVVRTLSASK